MASLLLGKSMINACGLTAVMHISYTHCCKEYLGTCTILYEVLRINTTGHGHTHPTSPSCNIYYLQNKQTQLNSKLNIVKSEDKHTAKI